MKKVLICLLVLCLAVVVGCSASPAAEVPATPVPDLNTDTVAPASEIEQETEEMDVQEEASAQEDESNKEPEVIETWGHGYEASYTVLEDGTAGITKLIPTHEFDVDEEFIIPAMLDDHIVSTIYDGAIQVNIEKTLYSNHIYLFYKIYIPDSVVFLDGYPFQNPSTTFYKPSVSVSESHPTLAVIDDVLYDKVTKSLIHCPTKIKNTSIIVPEGILEIGENAFFDCGNLEEIQLPNTLKIIGDKAFYNCPLTSITIGNSVEKIGNKAFYNCPLTSITIGNSVEKIGNEAFYQDEGIFISSQRQNLTNLTMPDSITLSERPFTFYDSFTIKLIKNTEKEPTLSIDNGVLVDLTGNRIVGCINKKITSYEIPDGIVSIDDYAFYKCENLKAISIPNSVTNIGKGAFYDCKNLKSISIPDNVSNIGEYTFSKCENLKTVSIPDNVSNIGECAFLDCSSLKKVILPSNIKKISRSSFWGCNMLENVVIPNGVEIIEKYAFHLCKNLTSISIPDSVKTIDEGAFDSCYSLQEIVIPNGVEIIGDDAFKNCKELRCVTLPETLTNVGQYAFRLDKNLLTFVVVRDSYAHSYAKDFSYENKNVEISFAQSLATPSDTSEIDWLKGDVTITPPPLADRTPAPTNTPVPTSTPKPTPYVSFTNKYGTRTTICHHSGCNEYIATSGDTNCCPKHSRRCLECGAYIDEDATYCMSCIEKALKKNK